MKQRIDCSNVVNFFREFDRLCRSTSCVRCYFGKHARPNIDPANNVSIVECLHTIVRNPKNAVSIIQKWSDNNQPEIPTYLEYFKKNFPFDKFTAKNSAIRKCFSEDADEIAEFCSCTCVDNFFDTINAKCPEMNNCYDCWHSLIYEEFLKELNQNENTNNTNKQ